jgi:hypothetical protein
MLISLLTTALAADLTFSPDRPCVGESTGTPGAGHVLFEVGAAAIADPAVVAVGAMGRIGLVGGFEVRLWAPTLGITESDVTVAGAGVGVKWASEIADGTAVSVVPEFFFGGGWAAAVGLNVSQQAGPATLWAHARPTLPDEGPVSLLVGGGVGVSVGTLSPYVNAGGGLETTPFVGGGTAIGLGNRAQIDVGVDVQLPGGPAVPLFLAGTSFGF